MTVKGTNVIGLKIISLQDGKEIGKVQDLIYDPDEKRIVALIAKNGGLFSDPKMVLINDLKNIGEDAIMIDSPNLIKSTSEVDQKIASIAKNENYITRTRIVTSTGVELGTISDLLFDQNTGKVEQFEVSQGGLIDVKSGKKYINVSQIETIGKDVIIVSPQTEGIIQSQEGTRGVQGKLNEGIDGAKTMFENVKTDVQEKIDEVKPKAEERMNQASAAIAGNGSEGQSPNQQTLDSSLESKTDEVGKDIQDAVTGFAATTKNKIMEVQDNIENKRKLDAVGRYLTVNILNPNDELIAKRGDMITHKLINQAEEFGLLSQVLNNNSEEPVNKAAS